MYTGIDRPSTPTAWTPLVVGWAMREAVQPEVARFLLRHTGELHASGLPPAAVFPAWQAVSDACRMTPAVFDDPERLRALVVPLVGPAEADAFVAHTAARRGRAGRPDEGRASAAHADAAAPRSRSVR